MVRAFLEAIAVLTAVVLVVVAYSERDAALRRAENAEIELQERVERADARLRTISVDLCRCAHGLMTSSSGKGVAGLGSEELTRLVSGACPRR